MEVKLPAADPAAYPPVRVKGPDPMCARAMLANLGGSASEMSTVAQYFYSSTVLEASYPRVAEYFHRIAVVEMRHLSILAELALLLGGEPRLWSYVNGRPAYWNAGVLTYSHELPALLNRAVTGESRTITEYRRLADQVTDPHIQAILERLVLDEEQHLLIFRRLTQECCPQKQA